MQDFKTLFLFIIVLVLMYMIFFIIVVNRKTSKYEKKFQNFALSTKSENQSLLDIFSNILWKIINFFSKLFIKSKILSVHSQSFDKYISYDDEQKVKGMDFLSIKILLCFGVFIITLLFCLIGMIDIPYMAIIFVSVVSYFIPNFILNIRFNKKRDDILNDLLDAIEVINTALNNGETLYNAISLVITELDGAICDEFKKISYDIDYGLTVCDAFKRFDNRINLNVTKFISNTLITFENQEIDYKSIFNYIEDIIVNKAKLKKEAFAVSFEARILVFISLLLPFVFGIILLFKPDYIKIILGSTFGLFILFAFISLVSIYGVIAYKILGDDL